MSKKIMFLFSLLVIFSLVLTACGGDNAPAPEEPAVEEPAAEEPAVKNQQLKNRQLKNRPKSRWKSL